MTSLYGKNVKCQGHHIAHINFVDKMKVLSSNAFLLVMCKTLDMLCVPDPFFEVKGHHPLGMVFKNNAN